MNEVYEMERIVSIGLQSEDRQAESACLSSLCIETIRSILGSWLSSRDGFVSDAGDLKLDARLDRQPM